MARSRLIIVFLFLNFATQAQTVNRYFVFFKDKNNSPYSVNQPSKFLSVKSIQRRSRFKIPITSEDLPVNPTYVQQVKATGAKTFFTSRWWNGVLVECEPALVATLTSLPSVLRVDYLAPGRKLNAGRTKSVKDKSDTQSTSAANDVQLQMMGLDEMHKDGFFGEGVSVALFDSGFEGVNTAAPFQHLFTEGRLKQTFNFVHNINEVFGYDDHGTVVFSVMAAQSANYSGVVPKADYYLFKTEDIPSEYKIEEYNWTFAAERADSIGIDVINASLGYSDFDDPSMDYKTSQLDGKTAVVTRAARKAIERGIAVVVSAGNLGNTSWKLITPPADAEGIISVGSITSAGLRNSFSSTGATSDGRIKPDVVALGSSTSVILPNGTIGTSSGTSLASPLVAGLAAGLRQKYPWISVSGLYEAIIRSANQFANPDNFKGYGLPDYQAASKSIVLDESIELYPNPVTGTMLNIDFNNPEGAAAIKIYSLKGELVFEKTVDLSWENNPMELSMTDLPAGTYVIHIITPKLNKRQLIVRP